MKIKANLSQIIRQTVTMSPGKRSIEHKLPKVRRFVNAHILFKFAQFDVNFIKASCDKQWMMSAVLKIDDYLVFDNDGIGLRIKEKQGRGWIWD